MTTSDPLAGANAGQAEFWTSGPGLKWAAQHARLDALFAPVTAELLDRAAIAPGENVLDIGCGAGDSTLAAADRAGLNGRSTGLDISETLLAVARRRAAGRSGIDFILADAQTHPFPTETHDLLISRFGLMFFSDPVAGFRNLARALKPGARVAFVTWARMEENPWNRDAKAAGVARLGPVPADEPRAPGQFAFAEIGYVTDILASAGFTGITGEEATSHLSVAGSAGDAAELATSIGPVSRILRDKGGTEADRAAIATDLADLFRPYEGADGVRVPAVLNFFSARRP
ncbi:class I SAM-dependent methyltransferase [Defluviimonas sp. SAOS-178_SWC]|uniref:class I SAM-dependent methyltransferase n=1 Tax=Defluviimonas sp. SAOS-178_SWC TaxID=3121287 RepID=UPI003221F4D2